MVDELKRSNSVGDISVTQSDETPQRKRSQSAATKIAGLPVTQALPQEPPVVIEAIQNSRANLIVHGPSPLAERVITHVSNPDLPRPIIDPARIAHLESITQERMTLKKFFQEYPPPIATRFQSFLELFQPTARARRASRREAYDAVVTKLEDIEEFQSQHHIAAGPGANPLTNGPPAQTQYLGLAQAYEDLNNALEHLETVSKGSRYYSVTAAFISSVRMTHEAISEGYRQPTLFEPESGPPGNIGDAVDNAITRLKLIWESGMPTEDFVFINSDLLMADTNLPKAIVSNKFAGAGQLNKVAKINLIQRHDDGTESPGEFFFKPLVNIAYGVPAVISHLPFIQASTLSIRDQGFDVNDDTLVNLPQASNLMSDDIGIWINPKLPQRNLAAYQVSEALSKRTVIVKSSPGVAGSTPGVFMEGAPGASGYQLAESEVFEKVKFDPRFREDLNILEWNDWITGQLDRHAGNFHVHLDEMGQYQSLKGIDNDLCFIPAEVRIELRRNPSEGQELLLKEIRGSYEEANAEYLRGKPELSAEEGVVFKKNQLELIRDLGKQELLVKKLGFKEYESYNGVGIPLLVSREVADRLRSTEFINQLESIIADLEPEAKIETLRRYDLAVSRINELERNGEIIDDWMQTLAGGTYAKVFSDATLHKEQSIYRKLELHREHFLQRTAANP